MCKIKDDLVQKILTQIEKKIQQVGEPTVHQFEDGSVAVNFFDTWSPSIADGALTKPIETIGDFPSDKHLQMVYSKAGTHVPLHDFDAKKTYVVLNGEIEFFFNDGEKILVKDLTSMIVPKDKLHGGTTIKDSFVMIIEDQCECDLPLS